MYKKLILAAALASVSATSAQAAKFLVTVEGNVSSVFGTYAAFAAVGDKAYIRFEADDAVVSTIGWMPRNQTTNDVTRATLTANGEVRELLGTVTDRYIFKQDAYPSFRDMFQANMIVTGGANAYFDVSSFSNNFLSDFLVGSALNVSLAGLTSTARFNGGNGGVQLRATRLTVSAIPEPSTWAMMIGGFGIAGYSLRRRKTGYATAPAAA